MRLTNKRGGGGGKQRTSSDNLFVCCTGCGYDLPKTTGGHGKGASERSVSAFIRLHF